MNPSKIPKSTPQAINVFIEIAKGSSVKTEWNETIEGFRANFIFGNGYTYPWNYGCVPSTLAEDEDPADVILLETEALTLGIVVPSVPIGILKLIDRGSPDHKIIALPAGHPLLSEWTNIDKLPQAIKNGILAATTEMARQKKKVIEILGFENRATAEQEIRESLERFKKPKPKTKKK